MSIISKAVAMNQDTWLKPHLILSDMMSRHFRAWKCVAALSRDFKIGKGPYMPMCVTTGHPATILVSSLGELVQPVANVPKILSVETNYVLIRNLRSVPKQPLVMNFWFLCLILTTMRTHRQNCLHLVFLSHSLYFLYHPSWCLYKYNMQE